MNEQEMSNVLRNTREDLGLSRNEVAISAGVELRVVNLLESNCGGVLLRYLAQVLDTLGVEMVFVKSHDPGVQATIDSLNVRTYDTPEDFTHAQEWARNAYALAVADAAFSRELGGFYT